MKLPLTKQNIKTFIKDYFEGLSQCLFFKNSYFGFAFILISILFNFHVFIFGLIASLISYFYSTLYRTPKILKQTGLMTINGFFFGIAFASFFEVSAPFYFCFLIGAFAIPLVSKATFEVLQHWKLSPLIFPYILTIWILWLCSNVINLPHSLNMGTGDHSIIFSYFSDVSLALKLIRTIFLSMGQIFFFRNSDYGFFLFLLITLFSLRRGLYFFLGTALATVVFYVISSGQSVWPFGFFSYSAGLVGIALSAMPEKFVWHTIILFCILSLFLSLALEQLLRGFGLPVLSLPYVLTFWFAMLSRAPRLNVGWSQSEVF